MSKVRTAKVYGNDISEERIERLLPANYHVIGSGIDDDRLARRFVMIAGSDYAGWSLDGYVLPRLASGLWFGTEVV